MEHKRLTLPAAAAILFVLMIYGWFISVGPWRTRGSTSDYYSRMADSFKQGQLALLEKPDPALLALPNPYDHKARKGIPLLGDASLYNGKYYLYFGPFPSLPLAFISAFLPIQPGDQIFVYLFLIVLFVTHSVLFIAIIRRFFADLPAWIIPLGILLLGLTGPYTRMAAHPYIHEAAIAGGQLFFTLGFLFAFLALNEQPIHSGKLFLAGLFWAFTVATRTTQLVPVAFIVLFTWFYVANEYRRTNRTSTLAGVTLALFAPLAVCGLILAWYNWARFDSIFEFGLYYQLAAFNLQANYDILFSRVYIVQNIYNYFLNPFEWNAAFPFAQPLPGPEKPILSSFELPNLYAVEGKFAGALVSTPFLIFSVLPPAFVITRYLRTLHQTGNKKRFFDLFDWTVLGLLGASLAGALPTLLLFYVGFRYETEFIASLTLLAILGYCLAYRMSQNRPAHKLVAFLGTSLGVFSVLVNLALAYNSLQG